MPSSKGYLDLILDQLRGEDVAFRKMMGEYVLYYRGKVIGGIYDDRLLLKPTEAAAALMTDPGTETPYPGAKEMLFVNEPENGELLKRLFEATFAGLEEKKQGKKKK